jgi:hypothetical protein
MSPSGRYTDDVQHKSDTAATRRQVSRSASCVSPLSSVSSASPASSPPAFMPYSAMHPDPARRASFPASDAAVHYPSLLPASDYLRRSMDHYRSPPYPPPPASRSPTVNDDGQGSSPEVDDGSLAVRYASSVGNRHRSSSDYYSPQSPYVRFQPFSPARVGVVRGGMTSPPISALPEQSPFAYPQYSSYSVPPRLHDNYVRRGGSELSDHDVVPGFR